MNLFNKNYYIQIHLNKLQLEKKKKKTPEGCKNNYKERLLVDIYIVLQF